MPDAVTPSITRDPIISSKRVPSSHTNSALTNK